MENDWERVSRHVEITDEVLRERIDTALHGVGIQRCCLIEEGHANTNYRIDLTDGSRVLLRIHVRDPEGARREAALSRLVHGVVPAPATLYTSGDGTWSVQEWMEGTTLSRLLDAGGTMDGESVGVVLADIGRYTFDRIGFLDDELNVVQALGTGTGAYTNPIRRLLDQPIVQERLGQDDCAAAALWLARDEHLIEEAGTHARLTHADYKPTNLLIRESRLVGVLDWEFAHAGMPLLDVAILMRDPRLSDTPFADGFVRGFLAQGGLLPNDWRRAANLLDLINMLQFLEHPGAGPNRVRACVSTIRRYLRRHFHC